MLIVNAKPLEEPKKTTDVILKALRDTGQRGILDRGWGDLGICKYIFCCFNIIICQLLLVIIVSDFFVLHCALIAC